MKTKWLRPRFLVGEGGSEGEGDGVRVDIHVGTRSGSSP